MDANEDASPLESRFYASKRGSGREEDSYRLAEHIDGLSAPIRRSPATFRPPCPRPRRRGEDQVLVANERSVRPGRHLAASRKQRKVRFGVGAAEGGYMNLRQRLSTKQPPNYHR
jgi:hypothetical protein